MAQIIFQGYGAHKELTPILKKMAPGKIFLVTGKKSYTSSGAENLLRKALNIYNCYRFDDFQVNPTIQEVEKGVSLFKSNDCDFIIGVGGGSVIDVAKSVSLLAANNGDPGDLIDNQTRLSESAVPTVIIPTTAGTGSESTHFSVLYIGKTKHSLVHPSMLPDIAILDPGFTESLSPRITACTGMDALCQGIEAFWSVNSTEESREYSRQAIKLALANLISAVNDPDKDSRQNMLLAGNFAGRAINIALTTAAHAVSYPLTSYFNVPHGHAVALTLPSFIKFNYAVSPETLNDRRGVEFVKSKIDELVKIMGADSVSHAKEKIDFIMESIHLETQLSDLGINKEDIEVIIKNGFNPQRIKNNPRNLTEAALRRLLEKIL